MTNDLNSLVLYTEMENDLVKELAQHLNINFVRTKPSEDLVLCFDETGLSLQKEDLKVQADFNDLLKRVKSINTEMIVKAVKGKKNDKTIKVIDATAGFGQDSFLLAAAGFDVTLFEYNPIICALLSDGLQRAKNDKQLSDIVKRMHLVEGDSTKLLKELDYKPDVVVLDPMFPERNKSALVKKKFQLLHYIEKPCNNEAELLKAAIASKAHKIIIKRPLKGPYLNDIKPNYSLMGKAIRYDVILNEN